MASVAAKSDRDEGDEPGSLRHDVISGEVLLRAAWVSLDWHVDAVKRDDDAVLDDRAFDDMVAAEVRGFALFPSSSVLGNLTPEHVLPDCLRAAVSDLPEGLVRHLDIVVRDKE